MKKSTYRLVLSAHAAILLSLAACVPEFDHPLSDEKTSKIDSQLLGKWEEFDEQKSPDAQKDKKVYWIFSPRVGTKNTIDYHEETVNLKGEKDKQKDGEVVGPATVFTTTFAGKRYLSLGAEDSPENEGGKKADSDAVKRNEKEGDGGMTYLVCRYEISDDGFLKIICPGQEFFGQAVATKKLPGKVEYTGKIKDSFDQVRITAKSAELADFLKSNADECFKDGIVLTFKRVAATAIKAENDNKETKSEPKK